MKKYRDFEAGLKAELADAAYSGLDHQAAADRINDPSVGGNYGTRRVNHLNIQDEIPTGATILNRLEALEDAVPDVKWAMFAIKSEHGIDIGNATLRTKLGGLVGQGELTQDDVDALLGMASPISIAVAKGWPEISYSHVMQARS